MNASRQKILPDYNIPKNNCVDQCVDAMRKAGVLPDDFTDDKYKDNRKLTLKHASGDREWIINLSIPRKLAEALQALPDKTETKP
jgi:hypothetical protein